MGEEWDFLIFKLGSKWYYSGSCCFPILDIRGPFRSKEEVRNACIAREALEDQLVEEMFDCRG